MAGEFDSTLKVQMCGQNALCQPRGFDDPQYCVQANLNTDVDGNVK